VSGQSPEDKNLPLTVRHPIVMQRRRLLTVGISLGSLDVAIPRGRRSAEASASELTAEPVVASPAVGEPPLELNKR
jgi:hypothetical protein